MVLDDSVSKREELDNKRNELGKELMVKNDTNLVLLYERSILEGKLS